MTIPRHPDTPHPAPGAAPSSGDVAERALRRHLRHHWKRYAIEGAILALLGLVAIALPGLATLATAIMVAWLLFAAGIIGAVSAFSAREAPGFWPTLLLSLLTIILGALLALQPIAAVLTLTMILVAYFIAHGVTALALAFSVRLQTRNWAWLVISAVIDFILAAIVLSGWPGTAAWVIGLMVGINLLFSGLALFFAAMGADGRTPAA